MWVCLPLAVPIGLSPLHIPTRRGAKCVLVVSTEPPDDLSCLTIRGSPLGLGGGGRGWVCLRISVCVLTKAKEREGKGEGDGEGEGRGAGPRAETRWETRWVKPWREGKAVSGA